MSELTVIDGVYTLIEQIAEGGMAVIYRAEVNEDAFDYTRLYAYTQVQGRTHAERQQRAAELASTLANEQLDRNTMRTILRAQRIPLPPSQVVVKVAKAEMDVARFEAEWQNLLCLNHPNLIKVFGGGTYLGRQYYAMERLDGLIGPEVIVSQFPLAEKLKVVIQAGRGLAFLHQNGIIHRDVKPENFLTCRADGGEGSRTLVTDLGIAKATDGSPGMTQTSQIMGTPYYMSPEQVRSTRDVDARADVYSLGATLYDVVLGVPPFHDKTTLFEIIASVSAGQSPIPPKTHNPELPEALDAVIRTAMAPDRDQRYPTMDDLVADLETFVSGASEALLNTVAVEQLRGQVGTSSWGASFSGAYRFQSLPSGSVVEPSRPPDAVPPTQRSSSSPVPASSFQTPAPTGGEGGQRTGLVIAVVVLVGLALMSLFGLGLLAASRLLADNETSGSDVARLWSRVGTGRQGPPVHLSAMKSNTGWLISLQTRSQNVKEILYRVGPSGEYRSTGHIQQIDMETGLPRANPSFQLPVDQAPTPIFIKLRDANDQETGPFEVAFDPRAEAVRSAKHILQMNSNWVVFRPNSQGGVFMVFTFLQSYRDAMSEVRYSLDSRALDQRLPLGAPDPRNSITADTPSHITLPASTNTVFLQIHYADGTASEVRTFPVRSP